MKYAILDGCRTLPKPRQKGQCPLCSNDVASKCGSKNVWHWAHMGKKHCDSWWEPETKWHREWKDKYPIEWQEVVHFDEISGEKHISDVRTATGLIIEFQNSPISSEELKQREAFYKSIVWIINGEKFKRNFHILHGLYRLLVKCVF